MIRYLLNTINTEYDIHLITIFPSHRTQLTWTTRIISCDATLQLLSMNEPLNTIAIGTSNNELPHQSLPRGINTAANHSVLHNDGPMLPFIGLDVFIDGSTWVHGFTNTAAHTIHVHKDESEKKNANARALSIGAEDDIDIIAQFINGNNVILLPNALAAIKSSDEYKSMDQISDDNDIISLFNDYNMVLFNIIIFDILSHLTLKMVHLLIHLVNDGHGTISSIPRIINTTESYCSGINTAINTPTYTLLLRPDAYHSINEHILNAEISFALFMTAHRNTMFYIYYSFMSSIFRICISNVIYAVVITINIVTASNAESPPTNAIDVYQPHQSLLRDIIYDNPTNDTPNIHHANDVTVASQPIDNDDIAPAYDINPPNDDVAIFNHIIPPRCDLIQIAHNLIHHDPIKFIESSNALATSFDCAATILRLRPHILLCLSGVISMTTLLIIFIPCVSYAPFTSLSFAPLILSITAATYGFGATLISVSTSALALATLSVSFTTCLLSAAISCILPAPSVISLYSINIASTITDFISCSDTIYANCAICTWIIRILLFYTTFWIGWCYYNISYIIYVITTWITTYIVACHYILLTLYTISDLQPIDSFTTRAQSHISSGANFMSTYFVSAGAVLMLFTLPGGILILYLHAYVPFTSYFVPPAAIECISAPFALSPRTSASTLPFILLDALLISTTHFTSSGAISIGFVSAGAILIISAAFALPGAYHLLPHIHHQLLF